jgi:hypothetical protein
MEIQVEKKQRSNGHLERFKNGLFDWYNITYEDLIENYVYCGGDGDNNDKRSKRHLNYWCMLFGNQKLPCKHFECVCGIRIKENCFVMDSTKTKFVHMGNCCIKRFMPENKSGRTCEICNESHRNRKYNLCNDCKTTNNKCKICNEYFEFNNKKHELCDECHEEKIKKENEELERNREMFEREIQRYNKEIHEKSIKANKGLLNPTQTATNIKQLKQCIGCNQDYETTNMIEIECLCNSCKLIKQSQIEEENIKKNQQVGFMCYCELRTILREVKKDGPNKGKLFYTCSNSYDEKCNYFMWKNESIRRIQNSEENVNVLCKCNLPAIIREVFKDGPNKGKLFYTCSKNRDEKCNYFMWKDENIS